LTSLLLTWTYLRGAPLTLAPAIAAINEMKRLNTNQRAKENGAYLGEKLTALNQNIRASAT